MNYLIAFAVIWAFLGGIIMGIFMDAWKQPTLKLKMKRLAFSFGIFALVLTIMFVIGYFMITYLEPWICPLQKSMTDNCKEYLGVN